MRNQSSLPEPPRSGQPRSGLRLVLRGLLFAFSPLLITLVGSIFVDDAFNESESSLGALPWLMIFTMPIGAVIVVIGLAVGVGNLLKHRG